MFREERMEASGGQLPNQDTLARQGLSVAFEGSGGAAQDALGVELGGIPAEDPARVKDLK